MPKDYPYGHGRKKRVHRHHAGQHIHHGHTHGKHVHHDHAHGKHDHGEKGAFSKFVALFQHNHSHGGGSWDADGIPGFFSEIEDAHGGGAGALVVEGPDDVGHGADTITGVVKKAAHGNEANPQTYSDAVQYLGTPHTHAAAIASLSVAAALTPLGLYTLFVSAHEAHEAGENREQLFKIRENLRKKQRDIARLLKREGRKLSPSARKNLKAQYVAVRAFSPYLDFMLEQNRREQWFWRSSQASGALISAKGIIDLGTTGKLLTSTSVAAATAGGVAAAVLSPLTALAAMGVGGFFTAEADAQRKALRALKPDLLRSLREMEKDPSLREYRSFIERKLGHRKRFHRRRVVSGSVFTGSAGLSFMGALVGGAVGALLAPVTAGASVPICSTIGAVLGGVGAAGALASVGILPYGHVKNVRHQAYEQVGRSEEATLSALADRINPGSGVRLRAQRLREIRGKHQILQSFLFKAAHAERLTVKKLERWSREPENDRQLRNFIRASLEAENGEKSYLKQKIRLRKALFPSNKTQQDLDITKKFFGSVEKSTAEDENRQKIREDLLSNLSRLPTRDILQKFLAVQNGSSKHEHDHQGKSPHEHDHAYKRFAEYCLKVAPKRNRAERGTLFESQLWAIQVEKAAAALQQKFLESRKNSYSKVCGAALHGKHFSPGVEPDHYEKDLYREPRLVPHSADRLRNVR